MKTRLRRLAALALSLLFLAALARGPGYASSSASGVYFTAANDHLMELSDDTMPFYSNGVLYVSSRLFEGSDLGNLGVSYSRHTGLGLAILYSSTQDLRFDMAGQVAYDKEGNLYTGCAIERGSVVFFPLNLVCRYFGLSWSYTETDIAPLIRVKSSSVILDDSGFISAASSLMSDWYSEYERAHTVRPPVVPVAPPPIPEPQPVQAAEGQKVYLLFDGQDAGDILPALGDAQATFLLHPEQMEDGDLIRSLVAGGHAVALRIPKGTGREEAEDILRQGREALWRAACSWLELVWYGGEGDPGPLLEELGCVEVRAQVELSGGAAALLRAIGRYREDVGAYLGGAGCLPKLPEVLEGLREGQYRLSAWRLTA